MSTFKKLLALTLALAMVLSVSAFAGYKADTYKDATSIDEDCEDAIELLYALDIMKGDNNGNFNPTATIKRAEIAKMIYVILNYGKDDKAVNYTGAKLFSDVVAGAWYEGYVNYCGATKLVQGRGNGTFGPNDPVTCAEAAKMLLTAIGYSAEARGYTGANWDKNVLSDATIIGLLKGYNYSTTTYAPRQWVAVMFQNALLKALTFDTMRPGFSGLLTSGNAAGEYDTMGGKYYGLDDFTAVAMATDCISLKGDVAESNHVRFDYEITVDNKKVDIELKNTGLGYEDLGREYRVIHNGDTIYSIRETGTSVVAESLLRDVKAETVTGTSGNWANNRYQFTIDDMVAKFNTDAVYMITVGAYTQRDIIGAEYAARSLYTDSRVGKNYPDVIKAIDSDGNGTIDYVVITEWRYASVASTGTSRAYGDYVTLKDQNGNSLVAYGGAKWYIEDVINCDETLEKGNYVKFKYNYETEMWDMEVLPVVEEVFDRVSSGGKYTIGGEVYEWVAEGYDFGDKAVLAKKNVGDDVIAAVDGDMLVCVTSPDSAKNDLEGINEQLVVVLDKTEHYYVSWDHDYAVKYLDINNDTHEAVFLGSANDFGAIKTVKDNQDGQYMLYILTTNDDGEVKSLKPAMTNFDALNAEDGYFAWEQAKGGAAANWELDDEMGNDLVALENTFFVGMLDSDGDLYVEAMTLEELGDVKTGKDARVEGVYLLSSNRKVSTLVGGYFFVDELSGGTESDYLYVTDAWYDKVNKADMASVILPDNTTDEIELTQNYEDIVLNELYTYTYHKYNDNYTLTLVDPNHKDITCNADTLKTDNALVDGDTAYELVEAYGSLFYKDNEIFVDTGAHYAETWSLNKVSTFALKVVEITRDEAKGDDPWNIDENVELRFTDLDGMKDVADTLVNANEIDGDIYYSDFHYVAEDILYVVVYRVVDAVQ